MYKIKALGKEYKISQEDIVDIVQIGLEGGISYWACLDTGTGGWKNFWNNRKKDFVETHASDLILNGKSLIFFDTEEDYDSAEKWELTLKKILNGIKIGIEKGYIDNNNEYFDSYLLDGELADIIIQCALFGDIVYG